MLKHHPEVVIQQLGLQICQNIIVGDAMLRGVSGGERKRVTTGEMQFGSQQVVLLDEISTDLDSAAASDIIATQWSLVKKFHTTVVVSLFHVYYQFHVMNAQIVLGIIFAAVMFLSMNQPAQIPNTPGATWLTLGSVDGRIMEPPSPTASTEATTTTTKMTTTTTTVEMHVIEQETQETADEAVEDEETKEVIQEVTEQKEEVTAIEAETETKVTVETTEIVAVSVSAETVESIIAETSAIAESCTVEEAAERDYSVVATIGSSIDADSVHSLNTTEELAAEAVESADEASEAMKVNDSASDVTEAAVNDTDAITSEPIAGEKEEVSTVNDNPVETVSEAEAASAETQSRTTAVVKEAIVIVTEQVKGNSSVETSTQEVTVEANKTSQLTGSDASETTRIQSESSVTTIANPNLEADEPEPAPTVSVKVHADGSNEVTVDEDALKSEADQEKTPKKKFSSLISRFADKVALKKGGAHRTESATKLDLQSPSPVKNIVSHYEVHKAETPQTHRTPSAAKLDLTGSSPVRNVVHRLETHDEGSLDNLRIRTKRDFFSESERSIDVSQEKQKYNALVAQRAQEEAVAKLKSPAKSPVGPKKSSALSSVRNMASRFEKKAEQSLDNLSFRTVRSFFPTENSVHVGAEKQKYEELERQKQAAKEAGEQLVNQEAVTKAQSDADMSTVAMETKESISDEQMVQEAVSPSDESSITSDNHETISLSTNDVETPTAIKTPKKLPRHHHSIAEGQSPNVRNIAHRFETKRAQSVVSPMRTVDTFFVKDSKASVRVAAEKEKYERNRAHSTAAHVRTVDTFFDKNSEASVRVAAEKEKFETNQAQSTAHARTVDTFFDKDSEVSVRVAAEKEKFETNQAQSTAHARTVDTFFDKDSEVSVRVAAEKEKFETNQAQSTAHARTVDTFFDKDSEVSVRVAAEKEKFETNQAQSTAHARTVDTFFDKDSEVSVRVAAEKEKFETNQAQSTAHARTVDTFFDKDSEVSIRVAAEKAKLEALEKQKVLEAQAAIERTKNVRTSSVAVFEEATNEVKKVIEVADEVKATENLEVSEEVKDDQEEIVVVNVAKSVESVVEAVTVIEDLEVSESGMVKVEQEDSAVEKVSKSVESVVNEVTVPEELEMSGEVKVGQEVTAVEKVTESGADEVKVTEDVKVEAVVEKVTESVENVADEIKTVEEVKEEQGESTKVESGGNSTEFSVEVLTQPEEIRQDVEVVVERQMFGDEVATVQHAHWLFLPPSTNPALARLHTVLSDHDPLTAFAMYRNDLQEPSSPDSNEDLPLPRIPSSAPPSPEGPKDKASCK
ncbi:hypothetical protein BBJ29_000280 [Phytophthora kernoviae]|uniref:Uncharacterized protein n=1 Tax=Phytophthora kernoviae TaxID=325452 RepID=A0A421FNU9_9STRA|nr:hypothetical protein BBJ29_000280 [Phytophthora kernoviae]